MARESVVDVVREKYGAVASGLSNDRPACGPWPRRSATRRRSWPRIPAEANMGLSCGNPTATANLRPGEVVVDLGCGGGLDVFLAAAEGRADRQGHRHRHDARDDRAGAQRAASARSRAAANVEFHLATIDALPLPTPRSIA